MADSVLGLLGSLGTSLINSIGSKLSSDYQARKQRELLDYQWYHMYSPQAQVSNLAKAGINPASAFGNSAPSISGSSLPSIQAPEFGIGTTSMTDLGNYLKSLADIKKTGVDIPNIEADTQIKRVEADAKRYELDLQKYFAVPERATALTLAWSDVMLKKDEHSINKWLKAKEKALSEASENERDILKKELDNMDTKLNLQNELLSEQGKTEKSKQSELAAASEAHRASAQQSRAQASLFSEQENLTKSQRAAQDLANEIRSANKQEEINAAFNAFLKNEYVDAKDKVSAIIEMQRLKDVYSSRDTNDLNALVDSFLSWLKDKASIFK